MYKITGLLAVSLASIVLSAPAAVESNKRAEITRSLPAVLWRNPTDITSRDLFYGPGGKQHQPHGPFTFVKEDRDGTSPKFVIRDQDGTKWKVKLGDEARPETAATRLVWAAGYFTNEDYFLPELRVRNMPRLHRGQELVASDGSVHNVRLKRELKNEEKLGIWRWRRDVFTGTRELNGLRVMMALINNWDLKDENNAVYKEDGPGARPVLIYMVGDLGASFGTTGLSWRRRVSKSNLTAYSGSKFISKMTPYYVDLNVPTRPAFTNFFASPWSFVRRVRMRWIGKQIPRAHARWMGQLLAHLSDRQIRDAFRAAGYSPEEVEGFSRVVQRRIAELKSL